MLASLKNWRRAKARLSTLNSQLLFLFLVFAGCAPPAPAGAQLVPLPAAPKLSPAGYQLILDYEVGGGQAYYSRYLARPTWPGAASGPTVGIGYDLGYNSAAVILTDWQMLPARARLAAVAGVKGAAAKARVAQIRDILIAWSIGERVFNDVTLTRFYQLTQRTFPGFDRLAPNCQAALVSLTFNRGSSMAGPSRSEMRAIRAATPHCNYPAIAAQIRAMKRLWAGKGLDGLLRRREAEARLVESCL